MKNGCEKYGLALVAHLEGALPAGVAAELGAHLEACEGCRAEWTAMKTLAEALEALGMLAAEGLPAIDVVSAVLARVIELREGRRTLNSSLDERAEVSAYLDGALDDLSVVRMERERANDAALNEELEALAALSAELEALGALEMAAAPKVDLVASVLARAKNRAVEPAALPVAVEALPAVLRHAAERFIEGEASTDQVSELRAYAAAAPELAAVLEAYDELHADLDALAADHARAVPRIDIVSEVMAAARKQQRPANVTPLKRGAAAVPVAKKRSGGSARWIGALAAAAACVLVGLYAGKVLPGLPVQNDPQGMLAKNDPAAAMRGVSPDGKTQVDTKKLVEGENQADAGQSAAANGEGGAEGGADAAANGGDATGADAAANPAAAGKGGRSLKDVLDARQSAFDGDQEALAKLMRWSTLSEREAEKLLKDPNADPAALIGAAEFLPANEAAGLLKAAVDKNPDDPYLRKALAKAYAESGDTEAARQQLDAWSKLDPNNSMPRYLAARLAFENGDAAGGLSAIEEAAHYQSGSTYSTQAAQYRRNALTATGYTNDVAGFLAGSTAGTGDYQNVNRLANELIDQGNQLRESGQYDDAQKVYLGVYNLGAQLTNSAQLASDYQTGYEAQQAALQALITLSHLFSGVDPAMLDQLSQDLQAGMSALAQLMNALNGVFAGQDMTQIMQLIAQTLAGGQLNFLAQ